VAFGPGMDLQDPIEEWAQWSRIAASSPGKDKHKMHQRVMRLLAVAMTIACVALAGGAGVRPF